MTYFLAVLQESFSKECLHGSLAILSLREHQSTLEPYYSSILRWVIKILGLFPRKRNVPFISTIISRDLVTGVPVCCEKLKVRSNWTPTHASRVELDRLFSETDGV